MQAEAEVQESAEATFAHPVVTRLAQRRRPIRREPRWVPSGLDPDGLAGVSQFGGDDGRLLARGFIDHRCPTVVGVEVDRVDVHPFTGIGLSQAEIAVTTGASASGVEQYPGLGQRAVAAWESTR